MLILTWNLYHGRAVPPAGRDLEHEFAARLAGWSWDVALLQEVPPWWPPRLAAACGAAQRTAPTSRNALPALRRALARRHPDLARSNGGGANAILVRGAAIAAHRVQRLRRWPEQRVAHGVALAGGPWVVNLHAQVHSEQRARDDLAAAVRAADAWSRGGPLVLGGDLNMRRAEAAGMTWAGGHGVDHVLARSLRPAGPARALERGPLSDHAPVLVELVARSPDGPGAAVTASG